MTVTAIRQTSPGRLTVCFEDGSEIKSTLGAVTELRLYSGRELDDKQTEEFKSLSSRSLARERALEIVSRRRMSEKELRDKLLQKGFDEDTADYCVRWLSENAFLNDEEYSLAVARHICDRVAVIDEGVIVEEGPTHQVLENPQSEAARELVSFDSLEVK